MKMRWNPETGEPSLFASDDEVPEGWLDYHPSDPDKATVAPPARKASAAKEDPKPQGLDVENLKNEQKEEDDDSEPLTRAEVVAALTAGGVKFDNHAKAAVLTGVLVQALKEALASNNVAFDENATPRALLKLVQG